MEKERLFYALTGNLAWIRIYLDSHQFPFEFDHIMGDGFYRVYLTQNEYDSMKKEAERENVSIEYTALSDICHRQNAPSKLFKLLSRLFR